MYLLFCVTLLFIINLISCEDCVLDHSTRDYSFEYQLTKDLLCNYKADVPPETNNSDPVSVYIKFFPRTFKFSKDEEIFNIYSWLMLVWNDTRLTWDPSKYGDLKQIQIMSFRIWTPGLRLFNTADPDDVDFMYTLCSVKNTGKVNCFPRILHQALCSTDLSNWPFDTQKCTLKFGEWTRSRTSTRVAFTFANRTGAVMLGKEYLMGWTIIYFNQSEDFNKTEQLSITFGLERQSQMIAVTIVVPALIVSVITITSFFIFVNDYVRLGLLYFNLLQHYTILSNISYLIPKHSWNTPKILFFVRSSLALTILLILVTLLLKYLRKRKSSPPVFIIIFNNHVNNNFTKHLIWPKWEADTDFLTISEDIKRKSVEEWNDFTNIVNSLFIFVYVIVYFCIFMLFMPFIGNTPSMDEI